MTGVVYKSTGSWYVVKTPDGKIFSARIKGKFKIDGLTSTNPIAVGDHVVMEEEAEVPGNAMITEIDDRRNYVVRLSPSHRKQHHIIASNLDQSILIATLKEPRTSLGFIDRFLVTCEAYHIPAIILVNKMDLWNEKEKDKFEEWKEIYEPIGYKVLAISATENAHLAQAKELLKDKVTLLSGHSGVGKSSFLNAIMPERNIKTKEVSGWSGKGLHTTTFAEMYDLPEGGQVIDTPGLREFGVVNIEKEELSGYFREMKELIPQCKYNNCLHMEEPGCAVKEAVMKGHVHPERYASYLGILDSIPKEDFS